MDLISTWKHRFNILKRIGAKKWFSLLGTWNVRMQPQSLFCIKSGYHHAGNAASLNATGSKDEWQLSVYEYAASLAHTLSNPSIVDVGCGSGYKLINLLSQYDTTGIEIEPAYSWLLKQYPNRKWMLFDTTDPSMLHADIVICSDVIEHIKDPDDLMGFLKKMQFRYLILSTPERDAVAGKKDFGPPENTHHYREWNAAEFKQYVQQWFRVEKQLVFDDKSITQVVVCSGQERFMM